MNILKGRGELIALFFVVAIGFFALRSSVWLVWNDSPQTAENLYGVYGIPMSQETTGVCRQSGASHLSWNNSTAIVSTVFRRAFSCIEFGGYRPLSTVLSLLGVSIFSDAHEAGGSFNGLTNLWLGFIATLFGLMAVVIALVSSRFLHSRWAIYSSLILILASPPLLAGGWIIFSGIQVLVPLLIGLGILSYQKICEENSCRPIWYGVLALVFVFGPWLREFVGIVAVLVIIGEWQRGKFTSPLRYLALLALVHAVFPTALMRIMIPELPLAPVFKLGFLSAQMGATSLKWGVAEVFWLLLPPSLLVGLFVGLISLERSEKTKYGLFVGSAAGVLLSLKYPQMWLAPVLLYCFLSARQGASLLLISWFLLSFLPFLKVYSSHVHLAYAVVPLALVSMGNAERLWQSYSFAKWRGFFKAALIFCLLDQSANILASRQTVVAIAGGIQTMANWFKANTPAGSLVIANALHAEDIRLYANNHFTPFWSVNVGIPPERGLGDIDKMAQFLKANFSSKPIYLLNIDQNFAPHKAGYHAHKYVTRKLLKSELVAAPLKVEENLLYLDPIRLFLPRRLVLFLGPPDLENDYFVGRLGKSFRNQVAANYEVYSLKSEQVSPLAEILPNDTFYYPRVIEIYKDKAIFGYRDKFQTDYGLEGATIEDVKLQIDRGEAK